MRRCRFGFDLALILRVPDGGFFSFESLCLVVLDTNLFRLDCRYTYVKPEIVYLFNLQYSSVNNLILISIMVAVRDGAVRDSVDCYPRPRFPDKDNFVLSIPTPNGKCVP